MGTLKWALEKFAIFNRLSWKQYEIGPWLLIQITNWKLWMASWSVSAPVTLSVHHHHHHHHTGKDLRGI